MRDSVARQRTRRRWAQTLTRRQIDDVDDLIAEIAQIHGVNTEDVRDTTQRMWEVVCARHCLWWLLRDAGWSYPQCASAVDANHSSVINALDGHTPCSGVGGLSAPEPQLVTTGYTPNGQKKVRIGAHMSADLADRLESYADAHGWSKSEAIRRAVAVMVHTSYGQGAA